jgi:uncharacterized SAM-binding protein YcdF (DUF218 family)
MTKVDLLAKKIWNYLKLDHKLEKSDAILVLGSHDIRVAERGAQLFLDGLAPLLIFSGGRGRLTADWQKTEADSFAEVAIKMGVPKDKIIIENKSTNTGENIEFTKVLLAKRNLNPRKFIVVQKPYMERRAYATFKKRWPEKGIIVTSPQIDFDHYPTKDITKDEIINIMLGDLQRMRIYPAKGFQITQDIPEDIWAAFEELVKRGYTKQLVKGV